jgi:pentalenene oxygenase
MMLTAATVTTASVMSWSLHVLSEQPAIEERLLADLAGGGGLGIDHRAPGYTVRFLMEILRVYPPVWIACRKTRSDAVLAGREVPAGVNVVLSSYLLHRDPDRYPEPDRFDPDRWRTVRPGITEEAAYIPFGLGPKGCIGEPFAWQELVVILDTITRTWRMRTAPGVTVRPAAETTLHPDRLPMIPRPR